MKSAIRLGLLGLVFTLITGCATRPPYNYTAYRAADPKSILVLPPKNASPDVKAPDSFYSYTQLPLAEAGYYIFPVTLVSETFKNNGLTVNDEIHLVSHSRLQQIFGADAALYITIHDYGTKYMVVSSASIVTASGQLVDLRTGTVLWEGKATASSAEGESNQGGLAAMLVGAIVKQVLGTALDQSHRIAGITSIRLLSPEMFNGVLYGPRNSLYKSK